MGGNLPGAQILMGVGTAGAALSLASTADIYTFTLPQRCSVIEIGVVDIVNAGSNAYVVKFDRRVTAGSDSGRGDGDVGALTSAASPTVGKATRKFVDVSLDKHDQVVVEVTDAGPASSTGIPYMVVVWGGTGAAESDDVASAA
jgi:hypothetical protein